MGQNVSLIALFFSLILTHCYFLRGNPCSETQSQCVRVGMPVAEGDADWTECRLAIIILPPHFRQLSWQV